MSPHGIVGPPDQSSPNLGNKWPLARPLTLPNFIVLGQTMYEKRITIFTPFSILAPQGTSWAKVHDLSTDVQQGPNYQCAKFHTFLTTCLRDTCCRTSLISLKAWPTKHSERCVSAYRAAATINMTTVSTLYSCVAVKCNCSSGRCINDTLTSFRTSVKLALPFVEPSFYWDRERSRVSAYCLAI